MYQQNLYKIVEPIKNSTISRLNKSKKWSYGYNKEHDLVVISTTGQIGQVYEIQGLKIALPKQPKNIIKGNNKWEVKEYPKELKNIKNIFDWKTYPNEFKEKWESYIDDEFRKREEGYWFYNKGMATYTGSVDERYGHTGGCG